MLVANQPRDTTMRNSRWTANSPHIRDSVIGVTNISPRMMTVAAITSWLRSWKSKLRADIKAPARTNFPPNVSLPRRTSKPLPV